MRTICRPLFLVTLILLSVAVVPAWDDVGHKITAYIAWQRMSPEAREAVIKVLRAGPEDSDLSAYYFAYGPEPEHIKKLEYFMLMATWADIVRDRALENRYRKYHKSNWHYDDTFWKQVDGRVEELKGFEEGGVAIPRLVEFEKTIRDAGANDREKAVAIAWIMHLTGDIHQPLHTSARVTELEPKGDQGGNLFLLSPQGGPRESQTSLHWFWDSIVGRNTPLKGETCERDYVVAIARKMMKRHPYNSMSSALKLGSYEDWRKESFALNPTDVFTRDLVRFQMPSERYKKNAYRIAERQLTLAGYRLGETLNRVFGARPVAANAAPDCSIIRKIMYPIFKKQTAENRAKTKPTLGLLDICPSGPAARPTIMVAVNGKESARAFDVVKTFATEQAARDYAAQHSIKDVNFDLQ